MKFTLGMQCHSAALANKFSYIQRLCYSIEPIYNMVDVLFLARSDGVYQWPQSYKMVSNILV